MMESIVAEIFVELRFYLYKFGSKGIKRCFEEPFFV
jgi:hypothetical protein